VEKVVVVIASVLKPVNDTRMYEKMAQSLISTGKFSVNILGFSSITHSEYPDIRFHSIFQFKRREYLRLIANSLFFYRLLKLKPIIIIVNTPELSPAILFYRFLFSNTKVVYDIRENHQRNLLSHHRGKGNFRRLLMAMVNWWEQQLILRSDRIIVAEKGYLLEKPMISNTPVIVIENKVIPAQKVLSKPKLTTPIKLLYTGTISTPYGIWDALRFAKQLHEALAEELQFVIIGHVTQAATFHQLTKLEDQYSWIETTISENPISHSQLLRKMEEANFGIVSHQLLPSIWNCFPTRIWEYMAHQLPFFLQNHHPWVSYCQPWHCCLPVDFSLQTWPIDSLVEKMRDMNFYQKGIPKDIYWEQEKFLSSILPLTTK